MRPLTIMAVMPACSQSVSLERGALARCRRNR
jgi:hypothetical protein